MRIEIVQELTGRVLKIAVEDERDDFGREMLGYQSLEGVLGAQMQWVNHMPQYLYELGNQISLTELFQKETLTVEKLKWLFTQLIQVFERAENYFLNERDMLLLADYMFYDERKKSISVAYLDGYNQDVAQGISKMLEQVMNVMNHQDKELVFLVYGLHKMSRETNFCLGKLKQFIDEKEQSHGRIPERKSVRQEPEKERQDTSVRTFVDRSSEYKRDTRQAEKVKKQAAFLMRAAGCLVAGVILIVIAYQNGLLQGASGEPDMKKTAVFILIVILLAGCVLNPKKEKQKEKKNEQMHLEEDTTVLNDMGLDETVLLEENGRRICYANLIPEDWQREEIQIRKSPVFIGKDATRADKIIEEGEISRIHAKFVLEEEGIFVIDQESTNGTYVNGERILPWERRQLKNDDKIAFSSIYYRVEMDS